MLDEPDGEPDVLASLVRSAIARRNLDSLPPLLGDWSSVEALDVSRMELARFGDGGRQANPLWASFASVREGVAIERLARRLTAHADPLTRVAERMRYKIQTQNNIEPEPPKPKAPSKAPAKTSK